MGFGTLQKQVPFSREAPENTKVLKSLQEGWRSRIEHPRFLMGSSL
jgi:hypothetical protein